jgi:DNA-binding transcriptional ArsR family regulator
MNDRAGASLRRGAKEAQLDQRLLKALGHPLRQEILRALQNRVASPSQLADELDEPLTNLSYHVKILAENESIELVRTVPVRGAVEHFYRAMIRPYFDDGHWAKLPASARAALFDQTLQVIWDSLVQASRQGGLDGLNTRISRTPLELDDEAYQELGDLLVSALDRAMELHAESAHRLADLPAAERDAHRTELVLMHFHSVSEPEDAAGEADI